MSPNELSSLILAIIQKAINEGQVNLDTVRSFSVGPDRFYTSLSVYSNDEWDTYPYYDEDEAIGRIPLNDWLDELDVLALEHPSESYEPLYKDKKKTLRLDVIEALHLVAADGLLRSNDGKIAMMEFDFLGEQSSMVVAFCHPNGVGDLYPLMEHRPPSNLIYPYGVLHKQGMTVFYPEGVDVEGTSFKKEAPGVKQYLFDDLLASSWDSERGIALTRTNDPYSVSFEGGHTYEDYGYPDRDGVANILKQHFETDQRHFYDQAYCPDPTDKVAFDSWMEKYLRSKNENGTTIVNNGCEQYGAKAMQVFIDAQPTTANDRNRTLSAYAAGLGDDGLYEEALDVTTMVKGDDKGWLYSMIPTLLMRLERYNEAVAAAEIQLADSEGKGDFYIKNAQGILALALSYTAQYDRAEELARAVIADDSSHRKGYYCLAHCLYSKDKKAATTAMMKAVNCGSFDENDALLDFKDKPELLSLVQQYVEIKKTRKKYGEDIKEKLHEIALTNMRIEHKDVSTDWTLSHKYELSDDIASMEELIPFDHNKYIARFWSDNPQLIAFDEHKGFTLLETIKQDENLKGMAVSGDYLYAAHRNQGLCVFNINDLSKPLICTGKMHGRDHTLIKIRGNLAIISESYGLDLYDISAPDAPEYLSTIGSGYDQPGINALLQDFVVEGDFLYLANNYVSLVIVDISDPRSPTVVTAIKCTSDHDNDCSSNKIDIIGDTLFLQISGRICLIDVCNPLQPKVLGTLKAKTGSTRPWIDDQGRVFLLTKSGSAYVFQSSETGVEYSGTQYFSEKLDFDTVLVPYENGFIANEDNEYFLIKEKPITVKAWEEDKKVPKLKQKIKAWITQSIEELAEEAVEFSGNSEDDEENGGIIPTGVLMLEIVYGRVVLTIDRQRSRTEIDKGTIWQGPPDRTLVLAEEFDEQEYPAEIDEYESDLPTAVLQRQQKLLSEAWQVLFIELYSELKAENVFDDFETARLYLCMRIDERYTGVVDTVVNDNYDWQPYRYISREFEISDVEKMLGEYDAYKYVDRLVSMAATRNDVRNEIYRLAITGLEYALICTRDLEDHDAEGVKNTFIAVANTGNKNTHIAYFFRSHREIPEAEAILEDIYNSQQEDLTPVLVAAIALGKLESDKIAGLIRKLLSDKANISNVELACKALNKMSNRIKDFQQDILNALEDHEDDWALPHLARQLMRTGYRTIPESLVKKATEDKEYENMGDMGFSDDDDQDSAKIIEREWSATLFAEHVKNLKDNNDATSPIWPASLKPEKNHQGWRFWADKAGPLLAEQDSTDFMTRTLVTHIDENEAFKNDRAMLHGLVSWFIEAGSDIPSAVTLASAMAKAQQGLLEESDVKYAKRVLDYELANRAWEHIKNQEFDQARVLADTVLEMNPNDGEYLFLDARLVWMTDSIEAAIERVNESLKLPGVNCSTTSHGRGRLLNLKGCALDELNRLDEALETFELTLAADPENATYMANLAEIHHKLGHKEEAIEWAIKARKNGNDDDILATILDNDVW